MPLRVPFLLALLVAAMPGSVTATVVIALRTPDAVFVAADSRGHATGPSDVTMESCKIVASRTTVLAFAGLTSVPAMNFSTRDLLQKVLGPEMSFAERVRALDQVMLSVLPKIVDSAIKISPDYARKLEADRGEVMAVVAAGVEDGVPHWVARNYFRRIIDGRVRYQAVLGQCGPDCRPPGIALLGGTPGVRKALVHVPPERLARDWRDESKHIISIGAQDSPGTIALPIASVRVDKDGVHWLDAPASCQ